jgi:hypothetical protein
MLYSNNVIDNLKDKYLSRIIESYDIYLIFIFGSCAKAGKSKKGDIDIGVYLRYRILPEKIWDLHCELMDLFHRDDIDLVILNDAHPVLLFDLLRHHDLVYKKNDIVFYTFLTWARKRYWQYQTHFKRYEILLKQIRLSKLKM